MTFVLHRCGAILLAIALAVAGCAAPESWPSGLFISEIVADNQGVWIDENGETDDIIELANLGPRPIDLLGYAIGERPDRAFALPDAVIDAGQTAVLFADGERDQGAWHLPFRVSAAGGALFLWGPFGEPADRAEFPALGPNDAFVRFASDAALVVCRFATPGRPNGDTCGPPPAPELPPEVAFPPYAWPEPWPALSGPLRVTEFALSPASFVEVSNVSDQPVNLNGYALTLAATGPGQAWSGRHQGRTLAWPQPALAPGERLAVEVEESDVAAIEATGEFEGVLSLWRAGEAEPLERVDFMRWPHGASLARWPEGGARFLFCQEASPGRPNDACRVLERREVGDRLRHLYTPGDFAALAAGGTEIGVQAVKFVVDREAGGAVHLLSNAWDLHYTFIRERIDGQPHLDRCDPEQARLFNAGWAQFSQREYFTVEPRRYLLGTLSRYAGTEIAAVEFAAGDRIVAAQIKEAFFGTVKNLLDPEAWAVRPATGRQVAECRKIQGELPLLDPNAPYRGRSFSVMNPGEGYGVLTFVPGEDLSRALLGMGVIVVTDQVPNDIALVGGLITEAFQTPLAHVNVLSRARDTPNLALPGARGDPRLTPYFGRLVRFSVTAGGFEVRPAAVEEAEEFWARRRPGAPPVLPALDLSSRGLYSLDELSLVDAPMVGVKAAQLAELARTVSSQSGCPGPIPTPPGAFAIPVVYSREHYEKSGALELLSALERDPAFRSDPAARARGLLEVRKKVMAHPVDPDLLAMVETVAARRFGLARLRFRSSSNTEDLAVFNGAGLYTSTSGAVRDPERPIADAIRTVWASLFNDRAYQEREYYSIPVESVAMGVLVHGAFLSERANGVLVTRNVLEPTRSDMFTVNVQAGEASVTNPAPGVTADQLLYVLGASPRIEYQARTSLQPEPVMSPEELARLACLGKAVHLAFRERLDPRHENRWFAMDIEFKLDGPGRDLVLKQARPYSFGAAEIPQDCREF